MINTKRRRRLERRVQDGKPIAHLVHRTRNIRWLPEVQAALRRERR